MKDNFKVRVRVHDSFLDMYSPDIDDLIGLIKTYDQRIIFIENLKYKNDERYIRK